MNNKVCTAAEIILSKHYFSLISKRDKALLNIINYKVAQVVCLFSILMKFFLEESSFSTKRLWLKFNI